MVNDGSRISRYQPIPMGHPPAYDELAASEQHYREVLQNLHDDLFQHLTGIAFMSKVLERKLTARAIPEADTAEKITRMINQAITRARAVAQLLVPVELESTNLLVALRELAASMEGIFGRSFVVECDEGLVIQDVAVATDIYRIAQEAMNNAIKHSAAKQIVIRLRKAKGRLLLTVQDDGKGFPKPERRGKGMGLDIMGARARRMGGTLDVHGDESGGTTVTFSLPDNVG